MSYDATTFCNSRVARPPRQDVRFVVVQYQV
jgi:hypothetical protein